jgi:hypothetical protein
MSNLPSILSAFAKIAPKKTDDRSRCVQIFNSKILQHSPEITVEVDIPELPQGLAWVNYERLSKCCKSLEDLTFELGAELLVKDRSSEYRLPVHSFPRVNVARGEYAVKFAITRESLIHLSSAMFAATDVTADFDGAVLFQGTGEEICICAGDNTVFSTAWVEGQSLPFAEIVPLNSITGLIECIDATGLDAVEIGVDANSVMVTGAGLKVHLATCSGKVFSEGQTLRKVADQYPSWKLKRSDLLTAVKQASAVADKENDLISLEPRGNTVRASLHSSSGEYSRLIPADAVGEKIVFRLSKLAAALKGSTDDDFAFISSGTHALVRSRGFVTAMGSHSWE